MQNLIAKFLEYSHEDEVADDGDEKLDDEVVGVVYRSFEDGMSVLMGLSHFKMYRQSRPIVSSENRHQKKNLVVILPDFESFQPSIVEKLITIFSNHQVHLPVVFVIGIATTLETLYQAVSRSTLALLRTEKFTARPLEDCTNTIVEEILLRNTTGLKLGKQVYAHLLDMLILHTASVKKFVNGIKLSIMHHFYSNPLSILTDINSEDELKETLALLNDIHFLLIRMTPSFQRYSLHITIGFMVVLALSPHNENDFCRHIDSLVHTSPEEAAQLLLNDEHLKFTIPSFLKSIDTYHLRYHLGIKFLLHLHSKLPGSSSTQSLHRFGLNGELAEKASSLLEMLREKEMKALLENCLELFDATTKVTFAEEHAHVTNLLSQLTTLMEEEEQRDSDPSDDERARKYTVDYVKKAGEKKRTTRVSTRTPVQLSFEKVDKNSYAYVVQETRKFFDSFFR
ncbi:Origin recognition complex subunit 3 [Quaeritorhiza haematococci]|nr:Origin recognition complex subunit 3 [Quaeritorhiza haematococci]